MSEEGGSRIADARRRALGAKQRLALAAVAGFAALFGLAWTSHPGSKSASAASEGSIDESRSFVQPSDDDDDFGGFQPFGGIGPSSGAAPQAQSHVS